jgi:hypothetical protein
MLTFARLLRNRKSGAGFADEFGGKTISSKLCARPARWYSTATLLSVAAPPMARGFSSTTLNRRRAGR